MTDPAHPGAGTPTASGTPSDAPSDTPSDTPPATVGDRVRRSGPDTVALTLPGLGTVRLARPELAFVAGVAGLSLFGFLEWPFALVVGVGHLLAADRSSRTTRELGEALDEV